MNEVFFCPDCRTYAGEHKDGENQQIFVCPNCGKKIVNMQARWITSDEFKSLEEAEAHYLHLNEQISKLANVILRFYPNLPGRMYELGACGLAAQLLIENEAKKQLTGSEAYLEACDNLGSAHIRAKLPFE